VKAATFGGCRLLNIFIKREHHYLQEKFGKEYEEYLEKILIKYLKIEI